jgi:hypothetical protein
MPEPNSPLIKEQTTAERAQLLIVIESLRNELKNFHPNLRTNLSQDRSRRLNIKEEIYHHIFSLVDDSNYIRSQILVEITSQI